MTGSYDPELDTLYWPIGQSRRRILIGDDRLGDNLYSDSVVALDAKTGQLQVALPVHAARRVGLRRAGAARAGRRARGRASRASCCVQANRNGFFYVLDRTIGEFLLGTQFVKNVTWATGLDAEGTADRACRTWSRRSKAGGCARRSRARRTGTRRRSIRRPGSTTCRPTTSAASSRESRWSGKPGKGYMGGSFVQAPDEPAQRVLRAIDIQTGKIAWELPQFGAVDSWGGVLSTAGGVVFFGDDSGALSAADAANGQAAVELPDEPDLEGVADDLRVRQQAARRGRRGVGDHCVRVAGLIASGRLEDVNRLIGSGTSFRVVPLAKIGDGNERRGREPRDAFHGVVQPLALFVLGKS